MGVTECTAASAIMLGLFFWAICSFVINDIGLIQGDNILRCEIADEYSSKNVPTCIGIYDHIDNARTIYPLREKASILGCSDPVFKKIERAGLEKTKLCEDAMKDIRKFLVYLEKQEKASPEDLDAYKKYVRYLSTCNEEKLGTPNKHSEVFFRTCHSQQNSMTANNRRKLLAASKVANTEHLFWDSILMVICIILMFLFNIVCCS